MARFELAELRSQPGLYIFVPAMMLFLLIVLRENYDNQLTPILLTPGNAAVKGFTALVIWLVLLLMFYTVESVERERTTSVAAGLLRDARSAPPPCSPARRMAHGVVALVAMAASLLVPAYVMLDEGRRRDGARAPS